MRVFFVHCVLELFFFNQAPTLSVRVLIVPCTRFHWFLVTWMPLVFNSAIDSVWDTRNFYLVYYFQQSLQLIKAWILLISIFSDLFAPQRFDFRADYHSRSPAIFRIFQSSDAQLSCISFLDILLLIYFFHHLWFLWRSKSCIFSHLLGFTSEDFHLEIKY